MKKTLIINATSLSSLVLLQCFFSFLWLLGVKEYNEYNARMLRFAKIPLTQLTRMELSPTEFQNLFWQNSYEFIKNGKYYDVVRKYKNGGLIVIYCKHDTADDHFAKMLRKKHEFESDKNPFGSEKRSKLSFSKLLICYTLPHSSKFKVFQFYFLSAKKNKVPINYDCPYIHKTEPPPETIS